MPEIIGPLLVIAGLLAAAGVAKGVSPAAAAGALQAMGLPSQQLLVRLLGAIELAIAVWVITTGTRLAALVLATAYAGFAAFVTVALVRGLPIASCGCFGSDDTPPTWLHVGFDAIGVAVALAAAASPVGPPTAWLGELGGLAAAFFLTTVAALAFSYMLLAELPKTLALMRPEPRPVKGRTS